MNRDWTSRRCFLATIGMTAIAGCSGDGNTDEGGSAGTSTSTPDSTPADTETPTPEASTETEPATFEITEIDVPETVQVNEDHQIAITVRNTGDEPGTFEALLQVSVAGTSEWQDAGKITIPDVPAGDTKTWTSDPFSYEAEYQLQYRLKGYDTGFSYDVVLPSPEIKVGESSMIEVDVGYEVRPMVEVAVSNVSDVPTQGFAVTVDWLDASDEYLASSEATIQTLAEGETWLARVDPSLDIDDYEAIDDYEISLGQVKGATSLDPSNLSVVEDELRASEKQVLVRGTVDNNRDTELGYLGIIAKVYNSNGEVIGWEWTNETDIAAGENYRFEFEPNTYGRNDLVESHDVVLTDTTLSF